MISISSSIADLRIVAAAPGRRRSTSARLCGGMLVAMPTAMPDEPLTSRFGNARRQHQRLAAPCRRSSGTKSTVSLSMSASSSWAIFASRHLGVAHRRRVVAVDRAEVALPVDQRVAQREVLRHAHERVVDRGVAVRVVLAHHVADDARALHVRPVPVRCSPRASRTARGGAPASGRRAHRAARARRSRSSRNRGRSAASPLRG